MIAQPAADSACEVTSAPCPRPAIALACWSIGALVAVLWCAALVVGCRRLAGALDQPLSPTLMFTVGMVAALLAIAVRLAWHRVAGAKRGVPEEQGWVAEAKRWVAGAKRGVPQQSPLLSTLLPSAAILIFGAALSLRGSSALGLLGFWGLVAAEELWAWSPLLSPRRRQARRAQIERMLAEVAAGAMRPSPVLAHPADLPAEEVLQQFTRRQAADGAEEVTGWLRAPFAAGQRTANVHLAFCPPFLKTPHLAVEQLSGPPARIKTVQLLPYGARLDLKLTNAAEKPLDVVLQFYARAEV